MILKKKSIYQKLCSDEKLKLAPGVVTFLDFLKERVIPFNIATASGKENLDFFFKYLNLSKWFNKKNVSFNDGNVKSKPDPELFYSAISRLGIQPSETLIFEDSISEIKSAENAGVGK